jgi:hypothetical protein
MKNPLAIVIILIVLGGLVYFFMNGNPLPNTGLLQSPSADVSSTIGTEILSLLNQIKSLEIDASVFSNPAYKTLVDYSVVVPPQPVGRPNPFAPVR